MKKIYHLGTCSTNRRILAELAPGEDVALQDIKIDPVTPDQLAQMRELAGSYAAIFSKVARKYRELGLNSMQLTETDYRNYILQDYTFLKRPVIISGNRIFTGNAAVTVKQAAEALK